MGKRRFRIPAVKNTTAQHAENGKKNDPIHSLRDYFTILTATMQIKIQKALPIRARSA